jgi:hypothetical protein
MLTMSNTSGATSGEWTGYPFGAPEFTRVALSWVFCAGTVLLSIICILPSCFLLFFLLLNIIVVCIFCPSMSDYTITFFFWYLQTFFVWNRTSFLTVQNTKTRHWHISLIIKWKFCRHPTVYQTKYFIFDPLNEKVNCKVSLA